MRRPATYADEPVLATFRGVPDDNPVGLAGTLRDLAGWADRGREALGLLAATHEPARRLAVAAHLVRHLSADPLLPRVLLPTGRPAANCVRQTRPPGGLAVLTRG